MLGYSQNVVSAINKLPVYPGNVYRHGNFFSGYKELNRPGAVLTDLAFASTTFRPESLQEQFGKDYTEVIDSKTGRWIKPISAAPGEDEVLLKPGPRLRVKARYDKASAGEGNVEKGWAGAPPEVMDVISKDPTGQKIRTVTIKEEV